jgi:hypothetical protein
MARTRNDRTAALAFDAITVEGALIAPAMLARIAQHQAGAQTEADYAIPKGLTLRDEIARYFRIGQAMFRDLTASETPSFKATVSFIEKLLHGAFGFSDVRPVGTRTLGNGNSRSRSNASTAACRSSSSRLLMTPDRRPRQVSTVPARI